MTANRRMTIDRSNSRWAELFRLSSLAVSFEEGEQLVRRRIALYFAVLFVFYAVVFVVSAVFVSLSGQRFAEPYHLVHLALVAITFSLWQLTMRRAWSLHSLAIFDSGGTLASCLGAALFLACVPERSLPDYLGLVLALTQTLVARAAIVPSDPRRTLALGVLGFVPLFVVSYTSKSAADATLPPWTDAFDVVVWGILSAVLTSLISRVIYGLRKRYEQLAHLGQYTLIEKIGQGGMGTVYRAQHGMLRRPTAIKLLPLERAGAQAIARFEREVQLTATLTHPNIVAIYDFGRTPEGIFYYAMEFLDGIDLEALVKANGPQPPGRVVHILKQVAAALAEAHAAGLIHRDIKPANIVLAERRGFADLAKVVDFGLVKELEPRDSPVLSGTHSFVGTPLYTAPETLITPDSVDARSDLYSLGAVAYFLLTGHPVFEAKTSVEVYASHLYEPVVSPSERVGKHLPPGLDAFVIALLAKDPAERPADARIVLDMLEHLAEIPAWTMADAGRWWTLHGEAIRASLRATCTPASGATLAVDPAGRMPESVSASASSEERPQLRPAERPPGFSLR